MKKSTLLLAAFAVITFTACQKDKDDTPSGGSTGNSKLLKKLTKTEGTEVTVYQFSYDANKRVTSLKSTDDRETTLFSYDAAGNLVRVEETEENFHNIYTYSYENGIPSTGNFKSWERNGSEPGDLIEDDFLTYTVENGVVSKIHLEMTQSESSADFALSYTNGNLTRVQMLGADMYTATFTFGNKKPVFPVISKYILDHAGFSLQFAAKNDLLSAHFDFPGTEMDETVSHQYTYDAKGYVLTSTDGNASMKFEYE